MPRKIRQLISDLQQAGFVNRGGNGVTLTLSGNEGVDAKPYQEKLVRNKIEQIKP